MRTRITAIALMLVMLCATNTLALTPANSPLIEIQPFWTNTSAVNPTLSFNGTTANCGALVRGVSGTTKITATVSYIAKVYGRETTTGGSTPVDRSQGNTYTFYQGTVHQKMKNNVRGNNTYGCIAGKRSSASTYGASGVWSPDNSTGE